MKAWPLLLLLPCAEFAGATRADVAGSANYGLTIFSMNGGGGRCTSRTYVHDIAIGPVMGRSVAPQSVAANQGYAAQINNVPVAVADTRSHPPDAAVEILNAALLGNDYDFDGDSLRVHSVDPASAAGGVVTLMATTVRYSPPAFLTGPDSFRYTSVDANGDLASATVTLFAAPPPSSQPVNTVALIEQPDGRLLLRFRQNPGWREYIVQFTPDLAEPNWQTLTVAPAGADGLVELILDPEAGPEGYYRAFVF